MGLPPCPAESAGLLRRFGQELRQIEQEPEAVWRDQLPSYWTVWEIAMNSIRLAPRTIAQARRVRSRLLALQFRRWRRRLVAKVTLGCAAITDAWRREQQLMSMLQFDDRLLRDIGMTRNDVRKAVDEQRWTHAAWRLVTTAIARRRKRRAAEARIQLAARTLLQQRPTVTPRPSARECGGATPRLAA
jgi:uncharacterized protein DUF1127